MGHDPPVMVTRSPGLHTSTSTSCAYSVTPMGVSPSGMSLGDSCGERGTTPLVHERALRASTELVRVRWGWIPTFGPHPTSTSPAALSLGHKTSFALLI